MTATASDVREQLDADGYVWLDHQGDASVGASLGRLGEPQILAPADKASARSWSLSGAYGFDRFPWHTDGAVSSSAPRWLLLRAIRITAATSTELLDPDHGLTATLRQTVLRVRDGVGRIRYAPAALPTAEGWRIRWDPRICTPIGKAFVEDVEAIEPTVAVQWEPNRLLIIDNHRLLHRRPAVEPGSSRLIERTYVVEG